MGEMKLHAYQNELLEVLQNIKQYYIIGRAVAWKKTHRFYITLKKPILRQLLS